MAVRIKRKVISFYCVNTPAFFATLTLIFLVLCSVFFRENIMLLLFAIIAVADVALVSNRRNFIDKYGCFFYAKYHFSRCYCVFQMKSRKKRKNCKEVLHDFERAAFFQNLTPGRYKTITHKTAIKFLRQSEKSALVTDLHVSSKPLYKYSLLKIRRALIGTDCRKCTETCKYNAGVYVDEHRQTRAFYLVTFQKL